MTALERFGATGDSATILHPFSLGVKCTTADIVDIATELQNNTTITSLNLSQAALSSIEACAALAKAVGRTCVTPIQHIRLEGCGIRPDGIAALEPALSANPKLEVLELQGNPLHDEGSTAIARIITRSGTIRVLDVSSCHVGLGGARLLRDSMGLNVKIRTLTLAHNTLRAAGVLALCEGLSKNTVLTTLDLSDNHINAEGGRAIAQLLNFNMSIDALHVGTNYLSDSCPHIAAAVAARSGKKMMRLLDLSNNRIDEESCRRMAEVLAGDRLPVTCLSLELNPIRDAGLVALFHAIKGTSIQFLDLTETGLTSHSGVVIADLVASCQQLNSLQLDGNALGDDAIHEIAGAIASATALASLNLERSGMTGASVGALAATVTKHGGIRSLNLANNPALSTDDLIPLLDALHKSNTALEELDMSDLPNLRETEPIMALLVGLFRSNRNLQRVHLERTPIGALLPPPGRLTRGTAQALEEAASRTIPEYPGASFAPSPNLSMKSVAKGRAIPAGGSVVRGASSLLKMSRAGSPSGALVTKSAASPSSFTTAAELFRPPWALAVPLDSDGLLNATHDEAPEDGRFPPLLPSKSSLHHSMYPGYGNGRFSNAVSLQSFGNPVPFSIALAAQKRPFVPTADGSSLLLAPPRQPLKHSPYSLAMLEHNPAQLPVTEDQLRRKFNELDIDGSGFLDREEFKAYYKTFPTYGVPVSDREVNALFDRFAKEDSKISFDEFCVFMCHVARR